MLDAVSPDTFIHVAGGSISQPIVAIIGKASNGKPYKLTISISPINPPPGIPDITMEDSKATNIAIKYMSNPTNGFPNIPNKNTILSIAPILEPSICMVEPIYNVTSLMSFGTFIFSVDSMFTGSVASDDCVASDVTVTGNIFL